MKEPPDDFNIPDEPDMPGEGDKGGDEQPHGLSGLPKGMKQKKVKIRMSPSAGDVKFADMFGFTLSPTHGIIKFGVFYPESGEFVIHTQIALTPQGMVALSQSLQKNIERIRKKPTGQPGSMN
jgi:hypothetical protein